MNIFESRKYRHIIQKLMTARKSIDRNFTYEKLAAKVRIPKSYLSRVLRGDYNLSADQAFLMARAFDLDERKTEYFILLVELERCGITARRGSITKKIDAIVAEEKQIKSHVQAEDLASSYERAGLYYGDPLCQIIHVSFAIDRFCKQPGLLLGLLKISAERLENIILRLSQCGVITRDKNNKIELLTDSVHLPKTSPLFHLWQSQQRSIVSNKMLEKQDEAFDFNVVFSADDSTFNRIREILLETLTKIQKEASETKHNDVYQMAIHLFPWTQSG